MPNQKIKTIFIGTSDFGLASLKALIKNNKFDIVGIITQPDKKIGRKQILTASPIKQEALKNKILVLCPIKIADVKEKIKKINPDLIVVIAYGQIIPKNILQIPIHGIINVHGSLLPKYRGASCVQAAILNGDKKTGVTIIKMDKKLDSGPILSFSELKISKNETSDSLYHKLSNLSFKILTPVLLNYVNKKIKPKIQNDSNAIYVKKIYKQDGRINWEKSANEIERFVRGMFSWPGAFSKLKNNSILKIIEINNIIIKINKYKIGQIFLDKNRLCVQSGKNSIEIKKLQLEGRKIILAKDFISGFSKFIGTIFLQ